MGKLNYQDVLYKLYFKYNQYAEGEVIGEKKYPRDFVQSMFIDSFRQGETISEDMSDKIQSLALMAWDAEMSQFIKGLKETNDFLKIQLILEHYLSISRRYLKRRFYRVNATYFSTWRKWTKAKDRENS